MLRKWLFFVVLGVVFCGSGSGQTVFVGERGQVEFHASVPAGNYSGITALGGNEYAVVSDKSASDGFFVFEIDVDSITGDILSVRNKGFRGGVQRGGDCEGIAFRRSSGTLFISKEGDASIVEYALDGRETGRRLRVPSVYTEGQGPNVGSDGILRTSAMGNYGFESLAYDDSTHTFWTVNESTLRRDGAQATPQNGVRNVLRLQSFGDDLMPREQYAYAMDAPEAHRAASVYAMGVSEVAALGNGRLLVLEREFYVPKMKLGAFVNCKIYEIEPRSELALRGDTAAIDSSMWLPKRLLHSFRTRLTLFGRSIANYEGMCLGPQLKDGSTVLIMVSDSQDQYKGVLKDWFKPLIIRK